MEDGWEVKSGKNEVLFLKRSSQQDEREVPELGNGSSMTDVSGSPIIIDRET